MDSNEPDFIVLGEKVVLGPLRADLAAAYARWMNQLEVRRGLDHMGIATPHSQEKWVQENLENGAKPEPEAVAFTVYDRTDSSPVGTAGLFQISHAYATAKFAIAIGERRGQGLGTDATRLVLDFAFHVSQLRNVLLETLAWNLAGLTAYERAGFRASASAGARTRAGDESALGAGSNVEASTGGSRSASAVHGEVPKSQRR